MSEPAEQPAPVEPVVGEPASSPVRTGTKARGAGPGFVARIGLAVLHPGWALALASDRAQVGRSGSDLIAVISLALAATQLRGLAAAAWLGAIDAGLALRAVTRVLAGALTLNLGLLVVGALAVFALAGPRRNLGRAFDLACVAALPLWLVELVVSTALRVAAVADVPSALRWSASGLAYGWMGALIVLALRPARSAPMRIPAPPSAVQVPARRLGAALALVVAVGIASQAVWIAHHLELIKPMRAGDEAPAFALPAIEGGGALGAPVALEASRGKVVVLDFWATWCKPCLLAMPALDQLARRHGDVALIAINLDDPAAARALFDKHGYAMRLLADDGDTSQRYGVSAIPHTVVIDRRGVIREVVRGTAADLAAAVEAARAAP